MHGGMMVRKRGTVPSGIQSSTGKMPVVPVGYVFQSSTGGTPVVPVAPRGGREVSKGGEPEIMV